MAKEVGLIVGVFSRKLNNIAALTSFWSFVRIVRNLLGEKLNDIVYIYNPNNPNKEIEMLYRNTKHFFSVGGLTNMVVRR
jgi:hypothetical protein